MNHCIYYPETKLIPHHPQVLHQLVLQLFLMADGYEYAFSDMEMSQGVIVPYGTYFEKGLHLATIYRFWLAQKKPSTVYLFCYADLPDNIPFVGTNYDSLHSYLGEMSIDKKLYKKFPGLEKNDELFSQYVEPIITQLPFLRSYQKIEHIVPVIFNKNAAIDRKKIRKSIYDSSGSTGYIACIDQLPDALTAMVNSYEEITSQQFFAFDPGLQKTS